MAVLWDHPEADPDMAHCLSIPVTHVKNACVHAHRSSTPLCMSCHSKPLEFVPGYCTNIHRNTEHILPEQGASESYGHPTFNLAQSVWLWVRSSRLPVKIIGGVAHAVDEGIAREVLPDRVLQNTMELCRVG